MQGVHLTPYRTSLSPKQIDWSRVWESGLEPGIKKIMRLDLNVDTMGLVSLVYETCTGVPPQSQRLYFAIESLLTNLCVGVFEEIDDALTESNIEKSESIQKLLLLLYRNAWNQYFRGAKWLDVVLRYLNTNWIKNQLNGATF